MRDRLAPVVDSPPPTPKSVRPPLSPVTEAALRSACAYVLQDFKPSSQVYDEQLSQDGDIRAALDYAVIKEAESKKMEQAALSLSRFHTRMQPERSEIEEEVSEQISPDRYRYKPKTATEDLFKNEEYEHIRTQRTAIVQRAEQLMTPGPSRPFPRTAATTHRRSASNPLDACLAVPKTDVFERPRTAPRSDSVDTVGSTPRTDATDYQWANSTAPTTAAVTPAHDSQRASSQALHSGSENGSMPKVLAVDAKWMREELEKHRKAEEEARAQQELADSVAATVEAYTTPIQTKAPEVTWPIGRVPPRKPVPRSVSDSKVPQAAFPPRTDSRQSHDVQRSESRRLHSAPRSESRQEHDLLQRSLSRRASQNSRPASRARNAVQETSNYATPETKDFTRPSTAQKMARPEEVSRPQSRSKNITRQIKEYVRPGTGTSSRKPSVELSRSVSRSRSIDSFRSTVSAIAPSFDSSTSRWRSWKPWHRNQDSVAVSEVSRPGTSDSNVRGRASARDTHGSSPSKPKPPINLNRELPPLPGLDQWKPVEVEPEKPKHIVNLSSDSSQSAKSRQAVISAAAQQRDLVEMDEILAARMGSPVSSPTDKPSIDAQSSQRPRDSFDDEIPEQPTAPPPAPPMVDAAREIPGGFEHYLVPTSTIDPKSLPTSPAATMETMKGRRRSRSIQAMYPPELNEKVKTGSLGQAATHTEKSVLTGKAQPVNYSRTAGGPVQGGTRRQVSQQGHVGVMPSKTETTTPAQHSRTNSAHSRNFSRKLSSDDYTRMYDARYHNIVEITPTGSKGSKNCRGGEEKNHREERQKQPPPPIVPATDRDGDRATKKKRWWQTGSKTPKEKTWMDQVIKAGSHSGMILTDDVAGSPIVRY